MSSTPSVPVVAFALLALTVSLACASSRSAPADVPPHEEVGLQQETVGVVTFDDLRWPERHGGTASVRVRNVGSEPVRFEWGISVSATRPAGIPQEAPPPRTVIHPLRGGKSVCVLEPQESARLRFEVDPRYAEKPLFYLTFFRFQLDPDVEPPGFRTFADYIPFAVVRRD